MRSWERAWSLDEMRKGAGNWSLAGDAGVTSCFCTTFNENSIHVGRKNECFSERNIQGSSR